jgi:hypothetical protein
MARDESAVPDKMRQAYRRWSLHLSGRKRSQQPDRPAVDFGRQQWRFGRDRQLVHRQSGRRALPEDGPFLGYSSNGHLAGEVSPGPQT